MLAITQKQRTLLLFVAVLFVVGVVFGTMLTHSLTYSQQQRLTQDVQVWSQETQRSPQAEQTQYVPALADVQAEEAGVQADERGAMFWERLGFHGKWVLLIWLLGVTVVGLPFVLGVIFFKGVLLGFALATIMTGYAWSGFWFSLVNLTPANLLIVPALVLVSVSALSFSLYVIRTRIFNKVGLLAPAVWRHSVFALAMFGVLAVAALIEAYVSPALLSVTASWLQAS
jgi:stage II sporulation protein M